MKLLLSNLSLTENQFKSFLTADVAAGVASLTVDNISGFTVGMYILVGNWGEPTAELIKLHAATAPSGTTITLASNLVYDHYSGTPITTVEFNQVEFSRATTLAGSKSVLVTTAIQANRTETLYNDLAYSTGYAFSRFYNSASGAFSDYSSGVNYTGNPENSLEKIIGKSLSWTGNKLGDDYCGETQLIEDVNEGKSLILQKQDWDFELIKNDTSIATTENENKYALSALTYEMKYANSNQGIMNVRMGNAPLNFLDMQEMDKLFENVKESNLTAQATTGDTSITLEDSTEFGDSGTIYLGSSVVTYTTNTRSTGVLSGIPASGTGAVLANVSSGGSVWQGVSPAMPSKYSVFNGYIYLDTPVDTDYAGYKLKMKYLKKISNYDEFSDTTEIPFYEALSHYVAYKIELRKKNTELAATYKNNYVEIININSDIYKLPLMDSQEYYDLSI